MTNEELYIKNRLGKNNPFTVPEGYFDQFTSHLMDKLPERELKKSPVRPTQFRRMKPWLYAAACICVAAFCAAVFFNQKSSTIVNTQQIANVSQDNSTYYSDNYIEEEADYAMVDNQEIYACLLADMY